MTEPSLRQLPELGTPHIRVTRTERVLHLQIDRTERRNAFTQDMYRALKRAAIWAHGQAELDAVCLTGTDEWFASGGDMAGRATDPEGLALEWDPTEHFPFRHIERCSKLWVAAINGACHAGGVDLALHCDVVVASDRATFRVPELLRGIPDAFLAARLVAVVGLARARYLAYTAATIDAIEAERLGLVGKVVSHDGFAAAVDEVLAQVSATGPQARAAFKADLNRRLPAADVEMFLRAMRSPEMVEGMRAFVEKRPPTWPR